MARWALLLGFGTLLFVNFTRLQETPTIEGSGDNVDYPDDYEEIGSGLVLNLSSIDASRLRARRAGTANVAKSGQPGKPGKRGIWKEIRREVKDMKRFLPNLASNLSFDVRDMNRNFFSIAGDVRFIKNEVMYIKRQAHVIWENVTDTRRDHKRMNKTLWWILGNVTRVVDEVDKTSKEVTDMAINYESIAHELTEAVNNVADVSGLTNNLRDMSSEFSQIRTSLDYGSTKMSNELNVVRDIVSHLSQTTVDIKDSVMEGFEQVDYYINGAQNRILANMSDVGTKVSQHDGMLTAITENVADIGNNLIGFSGRINEVWDLMRHMGGDIDQVGTNMLKVGNQMNEFHGNVGQVNEKISNVDYKVGDVGRQLDEMGHHMGAVGTQFIGFLGTVNDNFNKVHSRLGDVHETIISNVSTVRGDLDEMKVQLRDIRKVIAEKCESSCESSPAPVGIDGGEPPHDFDYPEWPHPIADHITTEHIFVETPETPSNGIFPTTQSPSYPPNGDVYDPEIVPHEIAPNGHPTTGYPPNGHPINGHPTTGYPPNGHPTMGYPPNGHPTTGYPPNGYPTTGYPPNGHPINGHPINGHPINGQPINGHPINGQPINGHPINGQPINGHPINGQPINGEPINGDPINGHPINGHPINGHPINGHPINGHPINGHPINGQPINGHPINGHPINGHPINGHPINGHPINGHPINGQPINGEPINGDPINGHPINGHPINGQPINGHPINGHPINGHPINGHPINGHPINGHPINGHPINGQPINGHPINGQPINGEPINGHPINGHPINGHPINGQPINGHPINGHPINGHPINGQPINGHPINGHPINGHPINGHPINGHPINGHPINGHPINGQPINGHPINGHPINGHPITGHPINGHPINGHPSVETTSADPYPFPPSSTYAPTPIPDHQYPSVTTSAHPPVHFPTTTYAPTPMPGYPPLYPRPQLPPAHPVPTVPSYPPEYPHPSIPPTYPAEYPYPPVPPEYPQPPIAPTQPPTYPQIPISPGYPPHTTTPQAYPAEYPYPPVQPVYPQPPIPPIYPPHSTTPQTYPTEYPHPSTPHTYPVVYPHLPGSPVYPSHPTIQLPQGPTGPGLPIGCGDEFTGYCACVCPCECTCPVFEPAQSAIEQSRYHRFPYMRKKCQCLCSCPCRTSTIIDTRPMVPPIQPPATPSSPHIPPFEPPPGPSIPYVPVFERPPAPTTPTTTQSPSIVNGQVPVSPRPSQPDASKEALECCDQLREHITQEISWAVETIEYDMKLQMKNFKDEIYDFFDGVLRFHVDVSNLAEDLKHQLALAVAGVVAAMNRLSVNFQNQFYPINPWYGPDSKDDRSPAIRPPARPPIYRPGINPPEFTPPGQYPAYVPNKPHGKPSGRPQLAPPQLSPHRPPTRPQPLPGQPFGNPSARPPANLPVRPTVGPPTRPQRITTARTQARPSRKRKYQGQSSMQFSDEPSGSLRQLARNNPEPPSSEMNSSVASSKTNLSLITVKGLSNQTITTTTDIIQLPDIARRSLSNGNKTERSTNLSKTSLGKTKKKKKRKGCTNKRKIVLTQSHPSKLSQIEEKNSTNSDKMNVTEYEDDDNLSHESATYDVQAKPEEVMETLGTELAIRDEDAAIIGTQMNPFAFNKILQEHINDQLMRVVHPHSGYRTKRKRRPSRPRRGRGRNRYKLRPQPLFPTMPGFPFIHPPVGLRPPVLPIPIPPVPIPNPLAIRPPRIPDLFGSLPPGMMVAGTNGSPYSISYNDEKGNSWNVNVNRRNHKDASYKKPEDWKADELAEHKENTEEDTEEEEVSEEQNKEQKRGDDNDADESYGDTEH